MEYGLAKKITAWAHANRNPNKQEDWVQFCMKRLRTLKSFKIFKSEIKKLKTYSGWCPFKGLSIDTTLMQIQSGRTVPLIQDLLNNFRWFINSLLHNFCSKTLCPSGLKPIYLTFRLPSAAHFRTQLHRFVLSGLWSSYVVSNCASTILCFICCSRAAGGRFISHFSLNTSQSFFLRCAHLSRL